MHILTRWAALKQVVDVVPGISHNLGPHQLTAHEPQSRGYPIYPKNRGNSLQKDRTAEEADYI